MNCGLTSLRVCGGPNRDKGVSFISMQYLTDVGNAESNPHQGLWLLKLGQVK